MKPRIVATFIFIIAVAGAISADTLVLTNGRRVQGELLGVFGREIEFEERSGAGRRIIRVPRADIVRIEFQDEQVGALPPALPPPVPRGMRERNVSVNAREQWADTGIEVRAGQQVYFQSTGEVRWAPNRRDSATAAGRPNSPTNTDRPLPERPIAALIGRVGERDVFFIGDEVGPFRMRAGGRLYLGVNDDILTDNSGGFRVIVSY